MTKRAGIYCRISDDREGAGLGVARQEADCRELVERRGWQVADVYVDNDLSAYSGKPRPEYRRLLADLAAGHLDAVVAWHTDRLHRSPAELEDFIVTVEAAGAAVDTVTAGQVDLATPTGRAVARTLGAWARYESEHKAERQRRKALELAQSGSLSGGGSRPYGYDDDRMTIRADEAEVIRECARRVLAGEAVRAVAVDLNARGVVTSTGKAWTVTTLKRMLVSARISGQREHQPRSRSETRRAMCGEIVADAVWPAVVTKADTARLRSLLLDPHRRTTSAHPRRCLLTGILRCSRCGAPLSGRPRDDGAMRYVCAKLPGNNRCGRTFVLAAPADDLIAGMVAVALDSPGLVDALRSTGQPDDDATLAAIEIDEARLVQLGQDYDDGLLTRAEWLQRRDRVERRVEDGRRRLSTASRTAALDGLTNGRESFEKRWADMSLAQRRAALLALLDRVVVHPAVAGRNRFDADRFEIIWRG